MTQLESFLSSQRTGAAVSIRFRVNPLVNTKPLSRGQMLYCFLTLVAFGVRRNRRVTRRNRVAHHALKAVIRGNRLSRDTVQLNGLGL